MAAQNQRERLESLIFAGSWTGELTEHNRWTQDSPILPQVWTAYAGLDGGPGASGKQQLLINPFQGKRAGLVARELRVLTEAYRDQVRKRTGKRKIPAGPAQIAHVPGLVAAELYFTELLRIVLPSTIWWERRINSVRLALGVDDPGDRLLPLTEKRATTLAQWLADSSQIDRNLQDAPVHAGLHCREFLNLVRLVAALMRGEESDGAPGSEEDYRHQVVQFSQIYKDWPTDVDHPPTRGLIWSVALNREAKLEMDDSSLAIKADAGRRLFDISCSNLRWAVVDSGIDVASPAFRDWRDSNARAALPDGARRPAQAALAPRTRVVDCFDFTVLRRLLDLRVAKRFKSVVKKIEKWMVGAQERERFVTGRQENPRGERERYSNSDCVPTEAYWQELGAVVERACKKSDREFYVLMTRRLIETTRDGIGLVEEARISSDEATSEDAEWACLIRSVRNAGSYLGGLIQRIELGLEIDWSTLEPFLRDVTPDRPKSPHGTQVAGVLGADWRDTDNVPRLQGVCPDIEIVDLRVCGDTGRVGEFEVVAALQFLLHLNARSEVMYVHGVNLSLSMEHDFRSFGCGQTRVCTMAEQLVSSGVVVVVAAGNAGSIRYETLGQAEFVGYQTASITDPGNAETVITVGATHRSEAHQYGVSYFSSRGPTGDGRQKPDLVAPGEKITTTGLGSTTCVVDGTSFAAPHVSGAAALLMARHRELIGHPMKIKQILCNTATDLGRTPDFQGCGMLDVLRALQSI